MIWQQRSSISISERLSCSSCHVENTVQHNSKHRMTWRSLACHDKCANTRCEHFMMAGRSVYFQVPRPAMITTSLTTRMRKTSDLKIRRVLTHHSAGKKEYRPGSQVEIHTSWLATQAIPDACFSPGISTCSSEQTGWLLVH